MSQCYTHSFTCIDCSRQFDGTSVHGHTQCVTEHDKYAKGATKPGGFAEKGFYHDGAEGDTGSRGTGDVVGQEFLSQRAPWVCSVCSVTCTSKQTLESHASGTKHIRRVKARLREQGHGVASVVESQKDTEVIQEDSQKNKQSKKEKKGKKELKKSLKVLVKKELEKHNGAMKKKKLFKSLQAFLLEHGCSEKKVETYLVQADMFTVEGKLIQLSSSSSS